MPRSLHRRAAEVGLLGVAVPEEVGGGGGDAVDALAVTEAMIGSGASGGLIAALMTPGIALPHIVTSAPPP